MICGIIMLVFGILTLVQGKFMLTRNRLVEGPPAYVIGALLVAPLPLSFLAGVMLGALFLVSGDPGSERRFETIVTVVGLGIPISCLLGALAIGIAYAKPAPKRVFIPDPEGEDLYPPSVRPVGHQEEGIRSPRRPRPERRPDDPPPAGEQRFR